MKVSFLLFTLRLAMLVVALLLHSMSFAQQQEMIKAPLPVWVADVQIEKPATIPEDQIKAGIYYVLVDRQVHVGESTKPVFYNHFADYIVNQHGLERSSQINISFDPNYQTLTFHRLRLLRNGQVIDKFPTAKYSVLQREQELEKLIYDGRLSANVILDDVRVGDLVEYSYSIEGSNPVYGDIFSYRFYTHWSVPVKQQLVRVLWEKNKPLQMTPFNQAPVPVTKAYAKGVEYRYELKDTPPLSVNSQIPDWYDPYGWVMLTDSQGWSDVVDWALPLYESAAQTTAGIELIAQRIRDEHTNIDDRIHAALAFVQSDIRYLGLEMGENSHRPSPAMETLQRRYGDCKDKTVLLIALLKAMNIPAHPALVNSSTYKEIAEYPPTAFAFDHVIVHLRHQDKDWWLDPTRQYQQSSLDNLYQPDFGYALIIASDQNALTPMRAERVAKKVIVDEFDLSEGVKGKANYTITTHYYGRDAESQRLSLARSSSSDTAEKYLNFYKNYFPSIRALAPLSIVDENTDTSLSVAEHYEIENIWEAGEGNRFTVDFYANSIGSALIKVEESNRNSPFYLRHPEHITQTIQVKLADRNWSFDDEKLVEKNPFFEYRSEITFNKSTKILKLHFDYQALTDHVPAEQIDAYIKARKIVTEDIEYSIFDIQDGEAEELSESDENLLDESIKTLLLILIGVALYLAIIVFLIIGWNRGKEEYGLGRFLRYFLVALVLIPPFAFLSAGLLGYFPSAQVVSGDEVAQRDIKFMQRNKVLTADEKLLHFYSDALFDIREDGNGLTTEKVFSYWRDEDGAFNLEAAALKDIEKSEFTKGESWVENATLTLYREDGSDFLLFLSAEKGGHLRFRKEFESRWRKARMESEFERAFSSAVLENADLKQVRKAIRRLISKAAFANDLQSQRTLAELYSQGIVVQQNLPRALYFYERAALHKDEKARLALAWHLAVADQRIQDPERALVIAHELLEQQDSAQVREVIAAANAAAGNFARAQAEQASAISMMNKEEQVTARAVEKLREYQNSRPWIELWPKSLSRGDDAKNSEHYPLLKVAPDYPRRAASEGISGHIMFSFDVLSNGMVGNIKVEAEQPEGYFEAAGREALKQFVYVPKMVDGKAVVAEGIKNRFIFELEK